MGVIKGDEGEFASASAPGGETFDVVRSRQCARVFKQKMIAGILSRLRRGEHVAVHRRIGLRQVAVALLAATEFLKGLTGGSMLGVASGWSVAGAVRGRHKPPGSSSRPWSPEVGFLVSFSGRARLQGVLTNINMLLARLSYFQARSDGCRRMRKVGRSDRECRPLTCPRCGICAYHDPAMLFGSAHLSVRDEQCAYLVEAKEYVAECKYLAGARDGLFSVSDSPCPNLKNAIASVWRAHS